MLSRIDLRGPSAATLSREKLAGVLPRAELDVEAAVAAVRPICEDVRHRGAAAVREYTARFDGVDLPTTRVPGQRAGRGAGRPSPRRCGPRWRRPSGGSGWCTRRSGPRSTTTTVAPGATVTERYVPVGRAGVYVPGGLVAYPSSVVMNVVARRQVAGSRRRSRVGLAAAAGARRPAAAPAVLAACALLGVDEVHAAGGAQAIAMFAYGTADCAAVDTVTGPGNVYVAAAKRLLLGTIGTDAEAGPDRDRDHRRPHRRPGVRRRRPDRPGRARPAGRLPADHHRRRARRPGRRGARPQVAAARHRERVQAALAGQSACVLVDDLDAALAVADAWAPEHLEIQAEDAAGLARRVRNAGAVFVGPYAPVSLGDYLAGSNHVLPTGGTAPAHRRPVRAVLPARHPRGRVRRGRAGRGRAAHRRARRGRGPGRARRRRPGPRTGASPGQPAR